MSIENTSIKNPIKYIYNTTPTPILFLFKNNNDISKQQTNY